MSSGSEAAGLETALGTTVAWLARRGVSLLGSRELAVRGRTTGRLQTIPVTLLPGGGRRYLVAVRGGTLWLRNLRAAGGAAQLRSAPAAQSRVASADDGFGSVADPELGEDGTACTASEGGRQRREAR